MVGTAEYFPAGQSAGVGTGVGIFDGDRVGISVGRFVGSTVGMDVGKIVGGLVAMVIFAEPTVTSLVPRVSPTLLAKVESEMLDETVAEASSRRLSPSIWYEPISKYVTQLNFPLTSAGLIVAVYSFTCF